MNNRIFLINVRPPCLIHFKVYHCFFTTLLMFLCAGCSKGEDKTTLELIKKHIPPKSIHTEIDKDGVTRITSLSFPDNKDSLELFPFLDKLNHLVSLKIGYKGLTNDDLKILPSLPNLTLFGIGDNYVSDEGLRYISSMINLRRLILIGTNIHGTGLSYLKEFHRLEWLDLGNTPLDDSGIPHIVKNFPKLKKLHLERTKITPNGVMQLSNLLWLTDSVFPVDIANPGHEVKMSERLTLLIKYERARLQAIRSARAAGKEAPSLEDEARLVEHIEFMEKSYEERLKIEERRGKKSP